LLTQIYNEKAQIMVLFIYNLTLLGN